MRYHQFLLASCQIRLLGTPYRRALSRLRLVQFVLHFLVKVHGWICSLLFLGLDAYFNGFSYFWRWPRLAANASSNQILSQFRRRWRFIHAHHPYAVSLHQLIFGACLDLLRMVPQMRQWFGNSRDLCPVQSALSSCTHEAIGTFVVLWRPSVSWLRALSVPRPYYALPDLIWRHLNDLYLFLSNTRSCRSPAAVADPYFLHPVHQSHHSHWFKLLCRWCRSLPSVCGMKWTMVAPPSWSPPRQPRVVSGSSLSDYLGQNHRHLLNSY